MRVLVACEFSGIVRSAFRRQHHDAWSCDLLPAEDDSPYHLKDDVLSILGSEWDLLIAHPPCTYLCNSGVRWLYRQGVPNKERQAEMMKAVEFFRALLDCKVPKVCVENPVMHWQAAQPLGWKYEQIIQPWMFGHPESKATCLWLKGLPKLTPTRDVRAEMEQLPLSQRTRVHYASPGPDRWKKRSRTLTGIADAMAEQWGIL